MNLLSATEKDDLRKGFRGRLWVVLLFTLTAAFLIGLVMLLPSYLLTLSYFGGSEEGSVGDVNGANVEDILNLPQKLDYQLKLFLTNSSGPSFVELVSKTLTEAPAKITVHSIVFNRDYLFKERNGTHILLSGIATDRSALTSFKTILEGSKNFTLVEVPVGSFTRERNLPFSMELFIEK